MQRQEAWINRYVTHPSQDFVGTRARKSAMNYWPLTDIQVLIAAVLGLTLVLLVMLSFEKARVTRREFARLQEDITRLSEDVKTLQVAVLKLCISKAGPSTEQDSLPTRARSIPTGRARERLIQDG